MISQYLVSSGPCFGVKRDRAAFGLTGRLDTYMDDDLVWTSYFIGSEHAEAEFVDTVDMMTGEMFA